MRVLVTGGGGFLGRAIVRRLRSRGDAVRILARGAYPDLAKGGCELVRADLGDVAALRAACAGVEIVFHAAARVGVFGSRREFERVNVCGTRNLLAACGAAGVRGLVYTSSPSVVFDGRDHRGVDERQPYAERFLSPYAATKAVAEREILEASGAGGLLTCALRPHLIWGPGDPHLLPRIIARARAGRLRIVGRGDNVVDTVYIDNAAQAHLLAADKLKPGSPVAGSAYFITQGRPEPLWPWINGLLARFGLPPVAQRLPLPLAYAAGALAEAVYGALRLSGEPPLTRFTALQLARDHHFDIARARRDLGYEPEVETATGLERTAADPRLRELALGARVL